MISKFLMSLSNISLDVVKSFTLFIMLSMILSDQHGVNCGFFSFLNHSCHSKGSMLSAGFSYLCIFSFFA